MREIKKNIDGSLIKDVKSDKPGCLLILGTLILIPIFISGKLLSKIRRIKYGNISERDYAILQRSIQRKKKKEEERKK